MEANTRDSSSVKATMNYLADRSISPAWRRCAEEGYNDSCEGVYGTFPVEIHDVRPIAGELSLDRNGFIFTRHRTAVRDFNDLDAIRDIYCAEMEALIREVTGAKLVLLSDPGVRSHANSMPFMRPVHRVHTDYTDETAADWARKVLMDGGTLGRVTRRSLSAEEVDAVMQRRYAEYNIWRPIEGPVPREPLAIVDATTIAPDDVMLFASDVGDSFVGVYNPAHRWYYAPDMETDEVMIFKCFDSARDGRARLTLHSAFEHPDTKPDAPMRRNIELRAFAFFEE